MNALTRLGVGLSMLLVGSLALSATIESRTAAPIPGERRLTASRASSALSAEQKERVQRAINAIKNGPPASMVFRDSSGTVDTVQATTIAASLQKQLDDGRIKVDSTLSAHDYAIATTDGRASDAADEVDLHKDVVSGADSVFLQEVLVHEWRHKVQVNGSEAADEVEAYSLEKSYKDSLGLDSTNTHYRECVENLAHFQAFVDSVATASKKRKRSAIVEVGGWYVQAVLGNPLLGETGHLHWREPGNPDWSAPWPVLGGLVHPRDLLGLAAPADDRLLLAGNTAMGAGALVALQFGPTGLVGEQLLLLEFGAEFHCMTPPGLPGTADILDIAQNRVLRAADSNGDGVPDSVIGTLFEQPWTETLLRADWALHPILGPGLLLGSKDRLFSHLRRLHEQLWFARDTDGDGFLETVDPVPAFHFIERLAVIQEPYPVPGDGLLLVSGTWLHEVQVWRTSPLGDPLELLGAGLLEAPEMPLPLMRSLENGEWIRALDGTTGQWQGRSILIGEDLGELPPPQNLRIEVVRLAAGWRFRLEWDAVPGASYYRVETDLGNGFWLPFADVSTTHFELTLPNNLPAMHLFRVRARN